MKAEAGRAALSRYFSPNLVNELSRSTAELDRPQKQRATVLFADPDQARTVRGRSEPVAIWCLVVAQGANAIATPAAPQPT